LAVGGSEGAILREGGLADATASAEPGDAAGLDEPALRDLPGRDAPPSPPLFVDNGGPVIDRVSVQPIFWGRAWSPPASPSPSQQQVMDAFRLILESPYLSHLHQYRPSLGYRWPREAGSLRGSITVDTDVGTSSASTPTTNTADVGRLIENLFLAQRLPLPDPSLLYAVVMPPGIGGSSSGSGWSAQGAHFSIERLTATPFHVAWVGNGGALDSITALFSHELVEAITDPEGTAILGPFPTCGARDGWCEIGDICENHFVRMPNGVLVQRYWSENESSCTVPSDYPPDPFQPHPP
jgi:hypothetical protein